MEMLGAGDRIHSKPFAFFLAEEAHFCKNL
jgi:hypothetical protein